MWLVRDAVPSFDRFPFNIPSVQQMKQVEFHPAVTFLIGENGSGKSTIAEAIAVRMGITETGGESGTPFRLRFPDGGLHEALRLGESRTRVPADRFFLRAETVYDFANKLDQNQRQDPSSLDRYGLKSLHARSHGEAFLAIIQNRLRSESFFVLDEPEAALSPTRQLTLLKEIDWLVRSGCQFVIATHSPILMAYPDAIIYELGDQGIREVQLRETEHYQITRSFLERPESYLRHLIE